jgi:xanthosine utilization system XapX-like protein
MVSWDGVIAVPLKFRIPFCSIICMHRIISVMVGQRIYPFLDQ